MTGPVVTLRPILQAPSWAELGLPQTVLDCLLERPGVVVVSGAPARRPVETWAALLDAFNISLHGHIIVLERAREYFHFHKNSMVSQREWGEDFTDWRSAIAQATRTDCEVLALGDLSGARSLPAALAATHSARWVVGLLHEPNCEAVLARLIGGSPARRRLHVRELLASYLAGIVNLTQGSLELLLPDPDLRQELAAGAWHELRATHRWALPS